MDTFRGKVIKGESRGKTLGFPTANIRLHKKIPEGIYVAKIRSKKKEYPALVFIGSAKTFNKTDYKAEVYLLDFSGDLYDQYLTVYLLQKIRDNKKFDNANDLIEQMKKDLLVAKKFFAPWC